MLLKTKKKLGIILSIITFLIGIVWGYLFFSPTEITLSNGDKIVDSSGNTIIYGGENKQ